MGWIVSLQVSQERIELKNQEGVGLSEEETIKKEKLKSKRNQ